MYTINHGSFKFLIQLQEKIQASIKFRYKGIYLQKTTYPSHPQSPIIYPTTPHLFVIRTDPSKLNETHIHLKFFYLYF